MTFNEIKTMQTCIGKQDQLVIVVQQTRCSRFVLRVSCNQIISPKQQTESVAAKLGIITASGTRPSMK